ncbi:hypothetical protein BGX31_010033 [Mortierella sp. GBA43]|nr:hypothetical protein BGX31_010033 [Mortierella sp. GBA43]
MRPTTTTTTVFRNATRGASAISASFALRPSAQSINPLSKPSPIQRPFSWGLQGHHHQRFLSTSSQLHGCLKTPVSSLRTTSGISPRNLVVAGATTISIIAPLIWARAFGPFRKVAYCAEGADKPKAKIPKDGKPFVSAQELSLGSAMGFCSGYLFKQLGKMFILVAGLGYVSLQLLANAGYIKVDWLLIEKRVNENLDLDGDGKVTIKDAKYGFDWVIDILTRNVQFKSTFAAGFYLGFRYG